GVGGVEEAQAEPREEKPRRAEAALARNVLEESPAEVSKEAVRLGLEVRDDEVDPPVAVQVARLDAHAAEGSPGGIQAGAREERDVLEAHGPQVVEQEVHRRVVGHVDIRTAVVVEVRDDDPEPLSQSAADA